MKKLKISDSEAKLLLLLGALIMIAASYFLVFQKNQTKAAELEAANEQDAKKVLELQMMVAQKEKVEEQTKLLNDAVEKIISKYPSSVPEEKAIAVVQEMEDETGAKINGISFLMNNRMDDFFAQAQTTEVQSTETTDGTNVTAEDAQTAEDTATVTEITDATAQTAESLGSPVGYFDSLTLSYEVDYDGFKKLSEYANNAKDRMTIPTITASFDEETGMISGSLTVNLYYLTNTGKEYEAPVINGVEKGVSNIFRSGGKIKVAGNQEEGALNEDDGNEDASE